MLRGVADVNVLVSALIAKSPAQTSRRLIDAAFAGRWQIVVSPHLLEELENVVRRDKFRHLTSIDEADAFIEAVARRALLLPDAPRPWPTITRDPDDDYLDALISGDADLTVLTDLAAPVMRPADFLARVEAETEPR